MAGTSRVCAVLVAAGRQAAETRKLNAFHRSNAAKRAWATMRKNKIRGGRPSLSTGTTYTSAAVARVVKAHARLGKALKALTNV